MADEPDGWYADFDRHRLTLGQVGRLWAVAADASSHQHTEPA